MELDQDIILAIKQGMPPETIYLFGRLSRILLYVSTTGSSTFRLLEKSIRKFHLYVLGDSQIKRSLLSNHWH